MVALHRFGRSGTQKGSSRPFGPLCTYTLLSQDPLFWLCSRFLKKKESRMMAAGDWIFGFSLRLEAPIRFPTNTQSRKVPSTSPIPSSLLSKRTRKIAPRPRHLGDQIPEWSRS